MGDHNHLHKGLDLLLRLDYFEYLNSLWLPVIKQDQILQTKTTGSNKGA